MKLSRPITVSPAGWALLDIGALTLVVGGLLTSFAILSAAWNPLGSVTIGVWPFLLATAWLGIVTAVALLAGAHLWAYEQREAATHGATSHRHPHAVAAPVGVADAGILTTDVTHSMEPEPTSADEEAEEDAHLLVSAGR
jgi:hypothetical protein